MTGADRAALPIEWGSAGTQRFRLLGAHLWIEPGRWFRLQLAFRIEDQESDFLNERFLEARGTFDVEGSTIRFEPDSGDPEMQDPFAGKAERAGSVTLDLKGVDGAFRSISFEKIQIGGLTISPDTVYARALTQRLGFTASVVDQDGDGIPGGPSPEISVSDPEVLEVSGTSVRAAAEGEARIIASVGEFADSAVAIVRQVAAEILLQPTRYGLLSGDSVQFEPWILDSLQNRMDPSEARWSLGDSDLALVRDDGTVFASRAATGATTLRLEHEGLTREVPVGVVDEMDFTAVRSDGGTCGLARGGRLFCWLGDVRLLGPDRIGGVTPTRLGSDTYEVLDVGGAHGCAITVHGATHCWGSNTFGQIGDGFEGGGQSGNRSEPAEVLGDHRFRDIATGRSHTCAVTDAGTAYCWGSNGSGELGTGEIGAPLHSGTPLEVVGAEPFTQITAGGFHTCALTEEGHAYCWGKNHGYKLGTDSVAPSSASPIPLPVEGGLQFTSIVSGGDHNCGITVGGGVYCWGIGWDEELPGGQVQSRVEPSLAAAELGIVSLSEGGDSHCGLDADGDSYCWEPGDDGEWFQVPGELQFVETSRGSHRACGITADGTGFCWGNSPFGLGDGSVKASSEPLTVSAPF